ncbi:MAG: ATP-binding cassette domain-containing protein [Candidatus Kuenenbacteria bacterium]
MISIKNLSKSFGNNEVLKGLDFDIKRGEIVGLLGPNGAGKTTAMRILTGYLSANEGEIKIDGKDINKEKNLEEIKKKMGYLAEDNPLYPEMLVEEYLDTIAELRQIKAKERQKEIKKAVVKTGIEEVYYKQISDLSKGFKQRVGLAAAIIGDPEILILDEPTEGLDPNQRIDIRNLIKNLGDQKTVIISSHVLQEVENTCQRIIILNQGKIAADGKTREIIDGARGRKTLLLEIEGNDIENKLKNIVGATLAVAQPAVAQNINDNKYKFVVEIEGNKELRPQIFNLAKNNNWIIWEMHQKEVSLEDVFRELTK